MKAPAWASAVAARYFAPVDALLQRVSRARWGFGQTLGAPSLLLITVGRSTGQPRRSPLLYVPYGEGFAVVGTNFGKPSHPGWTANLLACPRATVVTGGREMQVASRLLEGAERERLWARFVAMARSYDAYQQRCARTPRLFLLEPVASGPPPRDTAAARGSAAGPPATERTGAAGASYTRLPMCGWSRRGTACLCG